MPERMVRSCCRSASSSAMRPLSRSLMELNASPSRLTSSPVVGKTRGRSAPAAMRSTARRSSLTGRLNRRASTVLAATAAASPGAAPSAPPPTPPTSRVRPRTASAWASTSSDSTPSRRRNMAPPYGGELRMENGELRMEDRAASLRPISNLKSQISSPEGSVCAARLHDATAGRQADAKVQEEHHHQQQERPRPRLPVPVLRRAGGVAEDDRWQSGGEVVERVGPVVGLPGRQQQRRGLPGDPRDRKEDGRDDR